MKHLTILLPATLICLVAGLAASVCRADEIAHVAPALPSIPAAHLVITDFGAAGDDKTDNTKAVQAAIDAAVKAGGGVVEVPAGSFLCGPIRLADRIGLQLDQGATLKMLPLERYPGGTSNPANFISGASLHDIAICGSGTIDGQGAPWWPFAKDKNAQRPRMIALSGCDRVLIENVKLMNSPMFHIAIGGKSSNVTVLGVTIRANPSTDPVHPGHNTDACDVTGQHVLVKDCDVSVGDDNFTCSGGTSDVLITHCTYGYGHGVSIGSHTVGEISHITVENCTFKNTEAGIRIKTDRDRGGHVHDLVYRDLQMTNVEVPILIYEAYMATDKKYRDLNGLTAEIAAGYPAAPVGPRTPIYENISFINITATAASGHRAGLIWGLPESTINNVLLQNVTITADKPMGIYNAKDVRLVNTKILTPDGVNKLSTANAQVSIQQAADSQSQP
jgi:polygalacturonase